MLVLAVSVYRQEPLEEQPVAKGLSRYRGSAQARNDWSLNVLSCAFLLERSRRQAWQAERGLRWPRNLIPLGAHPSRAATPRAKRCRGRRDFARRSDLATAEV